MLIMLSFTNTLPNRKDEEFENFRCPRRVRCRRKRTEEGRMLIQNKCVSSQKHRMRKEEGATTAASHLPSLSGQLRLSGRTGSVLPWKPSNLQRESPINYLKCPTFDATAIFRHLIDK